jgi:hypothetical protein
MRNRPMAILWQRFPGAEWYGLQSFAPMRFDGISPYLRYCRHYLPLGLDFFLKLAITLPKTSGL